MSSAAGASIPVVDVSAWTHSESSADDQRIAAQAWDEAMKEFGFAIVVGHGVGEGTVAALDAVSRAFFSLPSYEKSRHGDSDVYGPEGYTRQGVEAVERSSSIKTPGTKERDAVEAPPDPVESFVFQAPPPPNLAGAGGRPLPRKPATLLPAAHAYWQSMDILLASLHRMSAAALGIDTDFFEEPYRYPNGNALRLAWYPSRDGGDGAHAVPRYGGHTDYQGFTILRPDPVVAGLQVEYTPPGAADSPSTWIDVPAVEDAFIVNCGDLMALWSNHRWHSAHHRVVGATPPSDAGGGDPDRLSLVFFTGPHPDTWVAPLGSGKSDTAGVRAGDHLMEKLGITNTQ